MKYILLLLLSVLCSRVQSQRLDLFLSQSYYAVNGDIKEELPYQRTTSFFDYIAITDLPDSTHNNQSLYFIYFTIPERVTEIGIRMISPVPENVFGHKGDVESEAYMNLSTDKKHTWFDPGFTLEYGQISQGAFTVINILGGNNDSDELMAQPNGQNHNALFRLVSNELNAGVYRLTIPISIDKEKPYAAAGSYLLQIGLVPAYSNIRISRKLQE